MQRSGAFTVALQPKDLDLLELQMAERLPNPLRYNYQLLFPTKIKGLVTTQSIQAVTLETTAVVGPRSVGGSLIKQETNGGSRRPSMSNRRERGRRIRLRVPFPQLRKELGVVGLELPRLPCAEGASGASPLARSISAQKGWWRALSKRTGRDVRGGKGGTVQPIERVNRINSNTWSKYAK